MDKILDRWRDARREKYRKGLIEDTNFDGLKVDCLDNVFEDCGEQRAETFLGTVFAIMPSGKYYMPWTSNQTRIDEEKDSVFMEALESILEENGLYLTSGEGDPCDMMVGLIDVPEEEEEEE
jgi:hypothetical protein